MPRRSLESHPHVVPPPPLQLRLGQHSPNKALLTNDDSPGSPSWSGARMFSDAESPLGRAGSEGICSQGGERVELSTWCRAISVLCSEMTSWVSQGAWRSPFHHATQGTEPSSLVSDPPKPRVGVEVALRSSLGPRLSLGTSKGSIMSQDVPHGKPHSVLGPSSGRLLPTTDRWPWSWGGGLG